MISEQGKMYYFTWHFLRVIMDIQYNLLEDSGAFASERWPSSWSYDFNKVSSWANEALGFVFNNEEITHTEIDKIDEFLVRQETSVFELIYPELINNKMNDGTKIGKHDDNERQYYAYVKLIMDVLILFRNLLETEDFKASIYWQDFSQVDPTIVRLIDRLQKELQDNSVLSRTNHDKTRNQLSEVWLDAIKSALSTYN